MRAALAYLLLVMPLAVGSGCQRGSVIRLRYPEDYRPPERRRWMSQDHWQDYSRGYEEGWRKFASRWRCMLLSCDRYSIIGDAVVCRKNDSAYERGFEDGQICAFETAESIEFALLPDP